MGLVPKEIWYEKKTANMIGPGPNRSFDFEKRLIKLENDMNEYNSKIQSKNNELAQFQIKVRKEFFNKLRPILEDYAKKNSIDIILKKENVLIGKTNLDISKNILDLFNKNVKKISVN